MNFAKRASIWSIVLLGAGLLILSASDGRADEKGSGKRLLSLSATASLKVNPDSVHISTGIRTIAPTASNALRENSHAMDKILNILKGSGVSQNDIQTTSFSVGPYYDRARRRDNIAQAGGFQVVNMVTIRVKNIAALGAILDKVVGVGANRINSISFQVSQTEEMKQKVRKMALEKARKKAQFYAENMGVTLGRVMAISENVSGRNPSPYMRSFAKSADSMSVPIVAGQGSLSATVHVRWELK